MTNETVKEIAEIAQDLMTSAQKIVENIVKEQPTATYQDAMNTAIFLAIAALRYRMDRDDKSEMQMYDSLSALLKP